jgi:hypothetical protein
VETDQEGSSGGDETVRPVHVGGSLEEAHEHRELQTRFRLCEHEVQSSGEALIDIGREDEDRQIQDSGIGGLSIGDVSTDCRVHFASF